MLETTVGNHITEELYILRCYKPSDGTSFDEYLATYDGSDAKAGVSRTIVLLSSELTA